MKQIWIRTQICGYEEVKTFFEEYKIGSGDLLFTQEFIYKPSVYPLGAGADILYYENYGQGEPSNVTIDKILAEVRGKEYKRIIAIGGGSVIDVAKLLVFDVNDCNTLDMFERKVELNKRRELIVIPTTCGTGSEVTNLAIVEIVEKGTKMGLGVDDMYADYAILIPEMLKSLPYKFFLYSAADALVHAVESYLSPKASAYTKLFSVAAIKMIVAGFGQLLEKGEEQRFNLLKEFLIASNYAGIAFGNAGVGAVHALSYPLGARFHIAHGESNYRCFTAVLQAYEAKSAGGKLGELKEILAEELGNSGDVFSALDNLLGDLIGRKQLREYGMQEGESEEFAKSVIVNQQRLLANNYAELSESDIADIYRKLY